MSSRLLIHPAVAAVVTILTVAVAAGPVFAVDPPSITGLSSRNSLSADDSLKIKEYAEAYTDKLLDIAEDPSEVRRIRGKLVDVIRRGGTSEIFRDTYSRYVLPGLTTVMQDGTPDQTVTAIVILSQLGTEQSLATLVEHCRVSAEPRRHVRLSSARSCSHLLATAGQSVGTNKISAAARGLAEAAIQEPDHHTLRHLIQAIYTASEATDDAQSRTQILMQLVEVLEKTATRATQADSREAAEFLAAIYPALHRLRTKYIVMDPSMQRELGRVLGPCVLKVLEVATAHWSEFVDATTSRKAKQPANIIAVCERFLATIDRVVRGNGARPPEEDLKDAWDKGDIQQFKAVLGRWSALLSRPPY